MFEQAGAVAALRSAADSDSHGQERGLCSGTIVSKHLVFGCAAVLLMAGSAVSAVPTLPMGED